MKDDNLPKHVAIIMDGNRRWAKKRGLPAMAGHRKVVGERIEELIERAAGLGIGYITFWAWSTENWKRSKPDVLGIMNLTRWALERRAKRLIKRGARVRLLGDIERFDKDIREGLYEMVEKSKTNERITVAFALNYGGRDEIVRAVRKLFRQMQDARDKRQDIEEEGLAHFLDTVGMPDPDLIIRTSGEMRMSGFMPWQGVYAEYYFTKTLMPDFGAEELEKALEEYGRRKRRFGKG